MAIQHSRDPEKITDADYVGFTLDVEQFLADDRSLPDRPDHLIAQQAAAGAAYRAVFAAMNAALGLRKQASDTIEKTVKLLKKKLNWMKTVLPTLSDESILLPFGLDKPVQDSYGEVKAMADSADAYWQTVALDPLYAPFADGCNDLADLIATYDSARATQVTADGEYSQRQNEKDLARQAHHEVERDIFTIYTATYPDPEDDYWTQTPWGKASGGGEEPEEPGEPGGGETPWGMVQGLEVSIDPIGNIYIKWKKVATAEKYTLLREVVPIGSTPPVLPYSVYMTGIPPFEEFVAYSDTDHDPGFAYYYSAIAVNAVGEETEACPPKGIEVM